MLNKIMYTGKSLAGRKYARFSIPVEMVVRELQLPLFCFLYACLFQNCIIITFIIENTFKC